MFNLMKIFIQDIIGIGWAAQLQAMNDIYLINMQLSVIINGGNKIDGDTTINCSLGLSSQGVNQFHKFIKPCIQDITVLSHHSSIIIILQLYIHLFYCIKTHLSILLFSYPLLCCFTSIFVLFNYYLLFNFAFYKRFKTVEEIFNANNARSIFIIMKKKQTVEETYKKVTQVEHILLRPDTYIGSIQMSEQPMWVLDNSNTKFEYKKIKFIPGLYKIFDQILVNAADNFQRDGKMSKIDVTIDENTGMITVINDGKSIPVQIHRQHKIYVAELIFGHLLTSSNYQDKKKKVTGGRNGFGAKLTNIFSSYFSVETADNANRKLLTIQWRKNMSIMTTPSIATFQGKDYTKVCFQPDLAKFGIDKISAQMISLFKKRVYDLAGILKCSVFLNSELVNIHNFHQYVKMYLKNSENQQLLYDSSSDSKRWSVVVTRSQGQFQQISFVNAICTTSGGTHVNNVCDQIVQKLLPQLTKKVKDIQIKPFQVKAHFRIFINCLIQNPSFNSQTKDTLTSNQNTFGSYYQVSDKLVKDISKAGITQRILNQVRAKQNNKIDKQLKKFKNNDNRLVIPKLQDANLAGRANKCTLILTEGDSAKTLAMSGIQKLGRDYYGVFPLRGKVFNVRDLTIKQVMENFQISSIVKIVGLSFGKTYTHTNDLRYSSIMIMADQDTDGSHIKGLLLNFFYTFWPSLCQIKGFLKQFITPIIRCKRGNEKVDFFCSGDYQRWRIDDRSDWKVKYYKGLGTSTSLEAQEYFSNLNKHQITFKFVDQQDKNCFDLAFGKKNADDRKKWLEQFDQNQNVDYNIKQLKIEDFFNKQFRHFSIYDNVRSIPSVIDGLKPSQRKILYACFKRNLKNEIKVAQLAGYVAEHSAYHHGEMSLCSTIVSMAQNYVGSNNFNLLQPIGQFGTRHQNGKDSASARYIFTCLNGLTRYLFNEADDHVVEYQQQQNFTIEPKYYYPILPLVLINGSEGIGTGWSTTIYPHKVQDVIAMVRQRIEGQYKFINIGWENYTGQVKLEKKGVFSVKGKYQIDGDTVTISQIPIGKSIRDYKNFLQQKVRSLQNQDPDIEDIKQYHNGDKVQFVITFIEGKQPIDNEMEKYLKLQTKLQQSNMTMFSANGKIQRYETIADIIEEFYQQRIKAYQKRKRYLITKFSRELQILEQKISFINSVMAGKYKMMETKQSWIRQLSAQRYKKFNEFTRVQSTKFHESKQSQDSNKQYNYLLNLPIWSFCHEKVVELEYQHKQTKKIVGYYLSVQEKDLWLRDLNQFEEVWKGFIQGRQMKFGERKKQKITQMNEKKTPKSKKNQQVVQDEIQVMSKPTKRVKLDKKNIVQQQLENEDFFNQFNAKKSGKQDWYRYQPVKVPSPQKEEDKISSLLSKYLPAGPSNQKNSLANRIKARVKQLEMKPQSLQQKSANEGQKIKQSNKMEEGNGLLQDELDWLE